MKRINAANVSAATAFVNREGHIGWSGAEIFISIRSHLNALLT
jgi:hypothetical protein